MPRMPMAIMLAALTACLATAQDAAAPVSAIEVVSVRDLGALGDRKADDTEAFEQAIKLARERKVPVHVPRGDYRLTRTVRLEGQLMIGQFAGGWPADSLPMPTLWIEHVSGPGIEMGACSSIHGLGIMYPEGTRFPEENAPPAISLAGGQPTITSVRIQYPYAGIVTAQGAGPGRARLADIFIVSPKHEGVYLTKSYDVSQLRNIEVWCNVGMSTGAGFRFGRNDDCSCSDLFAFNCHVGFFFETDEAEGGGRFYGSLMNCSTDACSLGYVVRGNHSFNLTTSDLINHHASLDIEGEGASIRLTGCHLQSNGAPAVVLKQASNLNIGTCLFSRAFDVDHFFINAQSCGSLTVMGCQFAPSSPGISLGEGVRRAVVMGNILEAKHEGIRDNMSEDAKKILAPNLCEAP